MTADGEWKLSSLLIGNKKLEKKNEVEEILNLSASVRNEKIYV